MPYSYLGAQARIVRVALGSRAVERAGDRRVLRLGTAPALDEVGIRDGQTADGDGIGVRILDEGDGFFTGRDAAEAAVGDHPATEVCAQALGEVTGRRAVQHAQVGEAERG